jgi:hypothetical protein
MRKLANAEGIQVTLPLTMSAVSASILVALLTGMRVISQFESDGNDWPLR